MHGDDLERDTFLAIQPEGKPDPTLCIQVYPREQEKPGSDLSLSLRERLWTEVRRVIDSIDLTSLNAALYDLMDLDTFTSFPQKFPKKEVDHLLTTLRTWYNKTIGNLARHPTLKNAPLKRKFNRISILRNLINDLTWSENSMGLLRKPPDMTTLYVESPTHDLLAMAIYTEDPLQSRGSEYLVPYIRNIWSRQRGLGCDLIYAIKKRSQKTTLYLNALNKGVQNYYIKTYNGTILRKKPIDVRSLG